MIFCVSLSEVKIVTLKVHIYITFLKCASKSIFNQLGNNILYYFPFFILKNKEVLSIDHVKKLYELLNSDLSGQFEDPSMEIVRLAAQKCHIGQAVNVKYGVDFESAVLRISLGARVISESWINRDISLFFRNIEAQMNQITVIVKKIELILSNPKWLD